MSVIQSGQSSYTHELCGQCGTLLYCSEAEIWQSQSDHGWCFHGEGDPVDVWTNPPDSASWHRCQPAPDFDEEDRS